MASQDQGNARYGLKLKVINLFKIKSKSYSLLICLRLGTEIIFIVVKWKVYAILYGSDKVNVT